jgi:hypothetical protein
MANAEENLDHIAAQLEKGVVAAKESARTFLGWFGASRRGYRVCRHIKAQLESRGLETDPDFEYCYIDAQISFHKVLKGNKSGNGSTIDPTYRIARLNAANRAPTSVTVHDRISTVLLSVGSFGWETQRSSKTTLAWH